MQLKAYLDQEMLLNFKPMKKLALLHATCTLECMLQAFRFSSVG